MNSKQRVLATLNHQSVDRTPIDCWLYQKHFVQNLERAWGTREKFWDEFGIDIVVGYVPWPNQLGYKPDIYELQTMELKNPRDDFWLSYNNWTEDFAGLNIRDALQYGDTRAILAHTWGIVEGTSSFLGIENCWMYLGMEPELMKNWFDRYADWLCALYDSLIDAGVDFITLSDDWGSNKRMLFAPAMWREMIKPYAMRVVQHAKSRGVPVNLHSDGHILDIMDDVIQMGYAAWHPVQESAGMNPKLIKEKYGDKITIYGSLDVIDGLLAYDGDALDEYITKHFEIYAPGGGFIFNTGHFVQPDIPPARLVNAYARVLELANEYGTRTNAEERGKNKK